MNSLSQRSPTARRHRPAVKVLAVLISCWLGLAHGEIRLSKDWSSDQNPDGTQKPHDQNDGERYKEASIAAAGRHDAVTDAQGKKPLSGLTFGTKLFVDDVKYFVRPAMFMSKTRPDEVCTPTDYVNMPIYRCDEGQRLTSDCHLMFFDSNFAEVGFNTVKINEPYQFFCNEVPAIGVRSKGSDDLLITVQYFPIDRKPASKISQIGWGWQRMTVLFHIKAVDGKIVAEQDDSCLGNPNRIETIPDARSRLAKCSASRTTKR